MTDHPGGIKSVGKAFNIIEYLADEGSVRVTRLAEDLDLPPSTAQVHLNTLVAHGVAVKRDGEYELGFRFLDYGFRTLRRHSLYPLVKPKVQELADETGEQVGCFVVEQGKAVYMYGTEGDQAIRTNLSMGMHVNMHCTAGGKAILAHLPPRRVDEIIETQGLPAETENTITTRGELVEELERIRERGYAFSREETIQGVNAVAAPVLHEEEVLGSISIAGPATRFAGERFEKELPELVQGAVTEIELNRMYSESGI